jgi:mono/diheme cytochrome c family protein
MKKTMWVALLLLVVGAMVLSACGGSGSGGSGGSSGIKRQNPPADFASQTNPMEGKADAVTAGKQVFADNCQTCHGAEAKGDGPAGSALNPKPANLQQTVKETNAAYMHWVITVGGGAAGLSSSMPSFQGVLSDDQIWQVDTYLRQTYGGK